MIRAALSVGFVVLLAACNSDASGPPQRFVLVGDARAKVLHQCSRPAPEDVTDFWTPSSKDMDDLESKLTPALTERHMTDLVRSDVLVMYFRQYTGIIVAGRRLIYGNFYPMPDYPKFDDKKNVNEAVAVCDGGPSFFGVTYDETERKIVGMAFNGALPPPPLLSKPRG
jgi:hypothetical protein